MNRLDEFNLDQFIEEEKRLIITSAKKNGKTIARQYVNWLTELKERRDSELRPADKFLDNNIPKQRKHILSELGEALEELDLLYQFPSSAIGYDKGIERAAEELVDLQMSCETMLAILGLDEQQRREARRKVIAKNKARGHCNE